MPDPIPTPFQLIGGPEPVEAIVARFYALMDADPAYAALRAMHGEDLAPVRAGLAAYLTAWLGGPRDWFDIPGNGCIMSLHRPLPITPDLAGQWVAAMGRAIADQPGIDALFAAQMAQALGRMAHGMINRAAA